MSRLPLQPQFCLAAVRPCRPGKVGKGPPYYEFQILVTGLRLIMMAVFCIFNEFSLMFRRHSVLRLSPLDNRVVALYKDE